MMPVIMSAIWCVIISDLGFFIADAYPRWSGEIMFIFGIFYVTPLMIFVMCEDE